MNSLDEYNRGGEEQGERETREALQAMYLLFLVINRVEELNPILERFWEIGISGATVLDSKGMGREFMECESPVVGGLRHLIYEQCRPNNKTIFSVVNSEEKLDEAIEEVEKITGDLDQPGAGVLFVLPLARVKGLSGTA